MGRLENTILYLLTRANLKGLDNLSKIELFKLVFLLEVESYRFTGKSFFDSISFVREKNGPISIDIYRALEKLNDKYINIKETKKPDYTHSRHCISLKKQIKKFDFKESEVLFMNSVFESYLGLTIKKLKEIVYNTEPMKEILAEEKKAKTDILSDLRISFESIPLDEDILEIITA